MKSPLFPVIVFSLFLVSFLSAKPPTPPEGKVWVLNQEMSDEFDANSPSEKWMVYDKQHSWNRTAAFDKRVHEPVKVMKQGEENYVLSMNPMWYEEEERFSKYGRTYEFAGGGMATHAMTTYGYIEIRIKPSNFPMGSGVFMNSRAFTDGPCGVKYKTELDIIENMGYSGPGKSVNWGDGIGFNDKMNINCHVKPTDENCKGLPYISVGGNLHKNLPDPLGFNVVGAWWKDKKSADYYLNDEYFQTIDFPKDFPIPMPVILTMETYVWESDDNNADNPKPQKWMWDEDFRTKEQRAVWYDWVRVWNLVDEDQVNPNDVVSK